MNGIARPGGTFAVAMVMDAAFADNPRNAERPSGTYLLLGCRVPTDKSAGYLRDVPPGRAKHGCVPQSRRDVRQ